jgi:hypothetical protein
MQNWLNKRHYRSTSLNEIALKFFSTKHLIYSIGPNTHVLGRFGPFRYCTKLDAKLVELVLLTQKFAKQCYVEKFRNERT